MDDEEARAASRAQWASVAEGWADTAERRNEGPDRAAADWMLAAADLAPEDRVLELACGAGDIGIRAAEAVGEAGRVVCTDFAEPMVDATRERVNALGLPQVETRVLDAEDLHLDGERFDAVLCRFGYMLMARPSDALRGSFEALVDDGRLALAVWDAPEANPWLSLITAATMKVLGAPPPPPGTPSPFALADGDRLRELLAGAGFQAITIERLASERRYDSPEGWWEETRRVAGPIAMLLSGLPEQQGTAIRDEALAGAAGYVTTDGVLRLPASVVVASARR